MLHASDLHPSYRSCSGLDGKIVLEVAWRLPREAGSCIRAQRQILAQRRAWMNGIRSAGSVFKNPEGALAGRLLETLGFKGFAVGGARVSEAHANVIVTGKGATASDVRALMGIMQSKVLVSEGIMLDREVDFWE